MYALKTILLGEVVDVIHSTDSNRVYLVLDPNFTDENPHYLYPLLCPLCGQPWHFLGNDRPQELMALLKKSMEGFELVKIAYISDWNVNKIESTQKQTTNSILRELFVTRTAEHVEENITYPVISLSFEILTKAEKNISHQIGSDERNNVENELDYDYSNHKEKDAIVITVHPSSILDTIVVAPEIDDHKNISYPYQSKIDLVERFRIAKINRL